MGCDISFSDGFVGEQLGIEVFDWLADLDQPHTYGIEHEAVVDGATVEVGGDRLGGCDDICESLVGSERHGLPKYPLSHARLQRVVGHDVQVDTEQLGQLSLEPDEVE